MKKLTVIFSFLIIFCSLCNKTLAQSDTIKVRLFERFLAEWRADSYNTGSEKYASLRALMASDCKMADRCAKGYIDEFNASGYDISAASWLQYIKTNQIGIMLRDLEVKQDDDGKTIVFCWIRYTQPNRRDKVDFVGFKFVEGKMYYLYTDDNERTKRIRSSGAAPQQIVNQPQQAASVAVDPSHPCVDLGLPSGTLWATTNIGAANPEDYGDYLAWGETTAKTSYNWFSYKYANGVSDKLTKYCTKAQCGNNGFVDRKTVLDSSDDVASVVWGSLWCMPTMVQVQELKNNCTWTWTIRNGKNGYVVKGPNGNTIFLPATGCRLNSNLNNVGTLGFYWSSSLNVQMPHNALYLHFGSGSISSETYNYSRFYGFTIRPVRRR